MFSQNRSVNKTQLVVVESYYAMIMTCHFLSYVKYTLTPTNYSISVRVTDVSGTKSSLVFISLYSSDVKCKQLYCIHF